MTVTILAPLLVMLFVLLQLRLPPISPLFPYTTLFRSIARRSARRRSRCATPCSPSRTEAATPAIASTSAALSTCPLPMRTGRVVTESPRGGKPAPGAFQRRTLCYSPARGSGNDILRACDPTLCLGEQFQKIFPKRRSSLDSLPRPLLYSASVDAGLWGFSPGRWGGKRTLPTSNRR